ncbi:hypothetical protein CRYO30217_00187 [Parvicella tangerina]|uniref:DUF4412 domain-containing protein n=2 Tax=Parvicella tangerina TaxID=2829795 RepID=A0A916NPH4_9FLAO|nr:hypothetical protein CRYO30217_00187 [Parvicella tangerina]
MKMNFKKSILAVAAAFMLTATSFAQFGGEIEFTKKVGSIEVHYKYYVSGDNVRVEEITDGKIEGVQLMDLDEGTMLAVSPERKMYMEVPNKRPASDLDVEVDKTGKTKTINGKKCEQIIVTCSDKDRKIEYWVAKGDYDFFIPMLKTLNRKENQSMFFMEIPGMDGYFPMLSTETTLSDGTQVSELTAGKMTEKKLSKDMFEVPAGFSKFEK